jgi:hypothetical protein
MGELGQHGCFANEAFEALWGLRSSQQLDGYRLLLLQIGPAINLARAAPAHHLLERKSVLKHGSGSQQTSRATYNILLVSPTPLGGAAGWFG